MAGKNIVADIGNTHIVIGIYSEDTLLHSFRVKTDKLKTDDEYYSIISNLCAFYKVDLTDFDHFSISSVVPQLINVYKNLSQKYFHLEVIVVDAYTDLGLKFPMPDPGFIGADLIVNAYAARKKYQQSCIICDFGTATTIQLVGADGYFHGTLIAPGVLTSAANLFTSASKLSNISLSRPDNILGINTEDALCSGIVTGNQIMVEGIIKRIKKDFSQLAPIKTVATGGVAGLICQGSSEIDILDKSLTLDGLNSICNR